MAMPISSPDFPGSTREEPPPRRPLSAPAPAPVGAPAREVSSVDGDREATVHRLPGTELVPAPEKSPTVLTRAAGVAKGTAREAGHAVRKASEGAIWTERPPSMRDLYERAKRADRVTDIPLINWVGDVLDWVCLVLSAALRSADWVVRRRGRLLAALLIVAVIVLVVAQA